MYSKIVQLARLYHLFQHENGKVFTNVESQMQKSNVDFKYGISFTKRESRIAIHLPAECSISKYRVITSSGAFGYIADELEKLCVIMLDKLENETATQRCIRKDVYRA